MPSSKEEDDYQTEPVDLSMNGKQRESLSPPTTSVQSKPQQSNATPVIGKIEMGSIHPPYSRMSSPFSNGIHYSTAHLMNE